MTRIDLFAATNTLLFVVLCVFRYYARFIHYRGIEHIYEFFIYGAVIISGIILLWATFRKYPFNGLLLALLQLGIFMHFGGAFVQIDGGRLYDAILLGIRYDKYVHFVNAFAATILIRRLFEIQGFVLSPVNLVFIVMVVLGLGAIIEIVEYMVVLTIPHNGVGDYDNNMQDLIGNLCGATTCAVSYWVVLRRKRVSGARTPIASLSPIRRLIG